MDIKLYLETPHKMDRELRRMIPNLGGQLKQYKVNHTESIITQLKQ
jgi:hypothetical protein